MAGQRYALGVLGCLWGWGTAVGAQVPTENSAPSPGDLRLEVVGEPPAFLPSSAPAYQVPKTEIQQQNPRDVAELLRNLPGFAINDAGFGADIHTGTFLRGFSINQILFQVNGRGIGSNISTYHGALDLNSLPVEAIERIEFSSGTSAALYGAEAFGGVVNFVTRQGNQPPTLNLGAAAGSYGFQNYRLGYGGTVDGVQFRVGYERSTEDNNYPVPVGAANRDPATGLLFNGDTRVDNFYGGAVWKLTPRNELSIDAYKSASRRGLLFFGFPLQRDRLDHDLFNVGAQLTTQLGAGQESTLRTTVGFNQDYFSTYGPTGASFFRTGVLDATGWSGRVEHQWQTAANHQLIWGLDFKQDAIRGVVDSTRPDLVRFNGVVNRDRQRLALFAVNTWQLGGGWQGELGLRQTFTNDFGSYFNPTAGLRWQVNPNVALRSSVAALQRDPGLDQLFIFDTVHNWLPNPNLVPERGVAWTAGVDVQWGSLLGQLTYFGSQLSDRLGIIAGRWENVGTVSTNGLEASVKWQLSPQFFTALSYTYTDARITSSATPSEVGLQFSTLPYSVGRIGLGYQSEGWAVNLAGSYSSGARRALFTAPGVSSREFSPPWFNLELNVRAPLSSALTLTLHLENLADVAFEKVNRIFQPGLTYRVGLEARF